MKNQLHVGTKADLSYNLRHYLWSLANAADGEGGVGGTLEVTFHKVSMEPIPAGINLQKKGCVIFKDNIAKYFIKNLPNYIH